MPAEDEGNRTERIKNLSARLRGLGMKATPQRLAILSLLEGNTAHPSAEEIYHRLKVRYPSLSLATVYGTLESLARAGALLELGIDPRCRRYDPDTHQHAHFLCRACGRVYDVEAGLAGPEVADLDGFLVESWSVNFYGICLHCRKEP